MESRFKLFYTLAIPYAFLCAGLYQLAYWLPFNINGFMYLSVSDIIMSYIQPFLYSSAASLIFIAVTYYNYLTLPRINTTIEDSSFRTKVIKIIIESVYLFLILLAIIWFDAKQKLLYLPFICFPGLYFLLSQFLLKYNVIEKSSYRSIIAALILIFPTFSITLGTRNAYEIYANKKFDYNTYILKKEPLKFLGKASDFYIFVSFNNKEKYIFSTNEVKGLNLKEYKRD